MDYKEILNIVISNRNQVLSIVLSSLMVSILYAFFLATPYYKSTATVYQKKESTMSTSGLSDFKSIAKNLGLNTTDNKINFYIPDLVKSNMIKSKILESKFQILDSNQKISLFEFWELNQFDEKKRNYIAKNKLSKLLDVDVSDDSGLFTILIETEDPILSSEIINFIMLEIQDYISKETSKHYSKKKNEIEKLMNQYDLTLKNYENELEEFQLKNSNLIDSPTIQLKRERLIRSVEISKELFLFLKLEYEQAKIQEFDNTEKIHILDVAEPNFYKSSPKRLLIILLTLVTSFFGSVYIFLIRTKFAK